MDTNGFSRREFMKVGGISLAATTVALNFGSKVFAASSKTPFGSVQFAVITDPHVDIQGTNAIKMSSISLDCVQKTVDALNMEKELSFVMVTGDLLQDGEWENARAIKKELDRLKAPYYVLAGNHDYDPILPKKHREGFTYMTIEEFVEFFKGHGYDDSLQRYYALQVKPGLRVIALDAELPLDPKSWAGVIPAEQLEWLDKQLADFNRPGAAMDLLDESVNWIAWTSAGDQLIPQRDGEGFHVRGERVRTGGITIVVPEEKGISLSNGKLVIRYRAAQPIKKGVITLKRAPGLSIKPMVFENEITIRFDVALGHENEIEIPMPGTPGLENVKELILVYGDDHVVAPVDFTITEFEFIPAK